MNIQQYHYNSGGGHEGLQCSAGSFIDAVLSIGEGKEKSREVRDEYYAPGVGEVREDIIEGDGADREHPWVELLEYRPVTKAGK